MTGNPTTPIPHVRVNWRPEQFNRVTNGTFETNTTGWAATAGINAAGTSITRVTTDFHSGAASATVVCTSTDGSGVNFDLGSNRFYSEASYGAMYVAVVWLKRVSGSKRAKVILGSLGTSTDRATLTITDLTDQWQPYVIRWLPTANRTDVELAITNGSAEALTFRVDDVAVYLVDAFSQLENGSFEVDTTGWSAYLSGSIARSTAESFGGSACARITSGATAFGGVTYTLSGRMFVSGRTYRVRVAVKTISGSGQWYLELSDGTTTTDTFFTPDATFTVQTADVTCAANRTTMDVWIGHVPASSAVMAIDEVEVFELRDELGTDLRGMSWSRSLDAVGTIALTVNNPTGTYSPRNASAALYGSLEPGKRVLGRATYGGALYPLFCGTLTTVEPDPFAGTVDLLGEDMLGMLRDADVFVDFSQEEAYKTVRSWVIDSAISGIASVADSPSSSAHESLAFGIDGNTHFRGTDGDVPALDLLAELNDATQSVHWIRPSVHANIGWVYTTQDRGAFTDTSSDYTVNEDFVSLDGVRVTHEALENRQEVPWQAYTKLLPPDGDDTGYGLVAVARDPAVITYADDDDPYLHYTDDEYGTDDAHPDPRWKLPGGRAHGAGWKGWERWRAKRKRGEKVPRRRKVYLSAFVPFTLTAGTVRRVVIDFAVPVSGATVGLSDPSDAIIWYDATTGTHTIVVDYIESRPNRIVVDLVCVTTTTVSNFEVFGTPWLPGDDLTETTVNFDSVARYGVRAGPTLSTAYIPSPAAAQGVGAYRNWRFSTPRLRPRLAGSFVTDGIRVLTADMTDHLTVTATRWLITSVLFAVTGCRWEVSNGALEWRSWHDLEELPTHTAWFTLDSSSLDGSDILAY